MNAYYSKEEQAIIREHFQKVTIVELSAILDRELGSKRNPTAIYRHATQVMKLKNKGRLYSEAEQEFIKKNYGLMDNKKISKEIKKRFGTTRNPASINAFAQRIGISHRDASDMIPLSELIQDLGVLGSAVRSHIKAKGINLKKGTKINWISEEDAEAIRKFFAPPPWPSMTAPKASRMIGVTQTALRKIAQSGRIRVHKQGRYDCFNIEDVHNEMRRRGKVPPLAYAS